MAVSHQTQIWLFSILAPRFEPLQESPVSSEASPEQTETQTNSSLISKSLESESKSTFSDSGQSQTYLEVTQVRQVSTSPSSGETQTSSYQSRDSRQRKTRVASVSPVWKRNNLTYELTIFHFTCTKSVLNVPFMFTLRTEKYDTDQ